MAKNLRVGVDGEEATPEQASEDVDEHPYQYELENLEVRVVNKMLGHIA